jgi:carbon-monoxide dehydrogenase medium subunit
VAVPGDIRIHRPDTVGEALSVLREYEEEAVPYAGGTELIPVLKLGLSGARRLVDLRRIPELSGIQAASGSPSPTQGSSLPTPGSTAARGSLPTPGSPLRLGATATHRMVLRSPTVLGQWPELAAMERSVGNIRVQGTGTIGGNLCFADPQSDPATFLTAAGARLACLSDARPPRYLPVEEFIVGPYGNALTAGEELLGWIELPGRKPGTAVAHRKVVFGERPEATCTVLLESALPESVLPGSEGGRITAARVAIGSVTAAPVLSGRSAELLGLTPTEAVRSAGPVADAIVEALGDELLHESRTRFMLAVTRQVVADAVAEAATTLSE